MAPLSKPFPVETSRFQFYRNTESHTHLVTKPRHFVKTDPPPTYSPTINAYRTNTTEPERQVFDNMNPASNQTNPQSNVVSNPTDPSEPSTGKLAEVSNRSSRPETRWSVFNDCSDANIFKCPDWHAYADCISRDGKTCILCEEAGRWASRNPSQSAVL